MQGSWRLQGGLGQLVSAMVLQLSARRLHSDSPVEQLIQRERDIEVRMTSGEIIRADHVVLAMPPRIATQLNFTPTLSEQVIKAASEIPTWMAGHAKTVAIYEKPFWIEQGLSGDAMSRHGPLAEIHDASPREGGPYALFGFVGTVAKHREAADAIKDAIHSQLGQLFGRQGLEPVSLLLKDWAFDPYTATKLDHTPLQHHPRYGRPDALKNLWNGRLQLGSTEMGAKYGGYLEGALEVADELASALA